jgi:hypothetical protein
VETEIHHTDWAQIAAWVFGLWAVMVPLGVAMMRSAVREIVAAQSEFQRTFHAYVLDMEKRMTLVEERLGQVSRNQDNHH